MITRISFYDTYDLARQVRPPVFFTAHTNVEAGVTQAIGMASVHPAVTMIVHATPPPVDGVSLSTCRRYQVRQYPTVEFVTGLVTLILKENSDVRQG